MAEHTLTPLTNPHRICERCGWQVTHTQHDGGPLRNMPCGHTAATRSLCPTWDIDTGCQCKEQLGKVEHPPAPAVTP